MIYNRWKVDYTKSYWTDINWTKDNVYGDKYKQTIQSHTIHFVKYSSLHVRFFFLTCYSLPKQIICMCCNLLNSYNHDVLEFNSQAFDPFLKDFCTSNFVLFIHFSYYYNLFFSI